MANVQGGNLEGSHEGGKGKQPLAGNKSHWNEHSISKASSFSTYMTNGIIAVLAVALPIIFLCAQYGAFKGLGTVTNDMIKYGSGGGTAALLGLGILAGIDAIVRNNLESRRLLQEALGSAIDADDPTTVKRLLEEGADLKHISPKGRTVFNVAITPDGQEQFKMHVGARKDLLFVLGMKQGYFERRWMEKNGIQFAGKETPESLGKYVAQCLPEDLRSVDKEGNTIFHKAIQKGSEFSKAVIGHAKSQDKENVLHSLADVKNQEGKTPLELAVEKQDVYAFEYFLDSVKGQLAAQKQDFRLLTPLLAQGGKESIDFIKRLGINNIPESEIVNLCNQSIMGEPTDFKKAWIAYMVEIEPQVFWLWLQEGNNREDAAQVYPSNKWDTL